MTKIILFIILLFAGVAHAECDQFYPNGLKIQPLGTVELCNVFFVTQYDDVNRKALFSSELLSPGEHNVRRRDTFRADGRVRNPVKSFEYYDSGYDRGHLVPADDANNNEEMFDTFLMTNMTPQNPKLNRGPWKQLENKIRKEVNLSGKPAIVVTGAIYTKENFMKDVPIPTGYYKILYIDGAKPIAYYANNNDRTRPHSVTVNWINVKTGLKFPKTTSRVARRHWYEN